MASKDAQCTRVAKFTGEFRYNVASFAGPVASPQEVAVLRIKPVRHPRRTWRDILTVNLTLLTRKAFLIIGLLTGIGGQFDFERIGGVIRFDPAGKASALNRF